MANLNTAAIQIAAENNETWSNSTETFDSTILESLASTIGLNETDEETLSFDDQLTDVGIEEETPNVEDVGIIIEVSQRVVDDNISGNTSDTKITKTNSARLKKRNNCFSCIFMSYCLSFIALNVLSLQVNTVDRCFHESIYNQISLIKYQSSIFNC